ncbi:methyltransferase domain protein [Ceratobasidium sp. AG-Ba]|nr:methyltransferase domain protein [Ceratobasidium sp. AG-Ba]QRW11672.1 methyltransferase domain protein [Ceratobasidium sp. AG-Ba]
MATEFPHCDITSVDIAPIATHAPRSNIAFEVYDLYAGVAEEDESFDYISCRHVQLAVKEYDRLLFDLHRVLRPGGLISICEVDSRLYEVDGPPYTTPISTCLPNLARGIDLIRRGIVNQGIDLEAIYRVGEWMRPGSEWWKRVGEKYQADEKPRRIPANRVSQAASGIHPIHSQVVLLPAGSWHPDPGVAQVGSLLSRMWQLAWRQLEGMLAADGLGEDEAQN